MPLAEPDVDRSTLRLSEVARHVVMPTGIVDTLWFDVEMLLRDLGEDFDTWQDGLGQLALGLRADESFAASVGGVVLSIPRQVAKTFLVGRIVFALCALYPNLNAVWTAQRVSTATSAFRSLVSLASRPAAAAHVATIRRASDEMSFAFTNGSLLRFGSRAQNFGRGETEIDVEVFDEAQILTTDTLEDMVPAANQARLPHGALLFFLGTPPRPRDPGEEFAARRAEALDAKPAGVVVAAHGDALYVECSADVETGRAGGPALMDEDQIARANPSYPHRTPWLSIQRMRKQLRDDDSWRREALGIWDEAGFRPPLIAGPEWEALSIDVADAPAGTPAFGVKFSADGSRYAVGVALPTDTGVHVEAFPPTPMARGITELADWLAQRWWSASLLVIDGKASADDLRGLLLARGVPQRRVKVLTTAEAIAAHAGFLRHVHEGTLTHLGQAGLAAAIAVAGKRPIGRAGGWGFESVAIGGDVSPVEAVTLAAFGAMRTTPGSDDRKRKVVLLR